jgi:hypothetical protein
MQDLRETVVVAANGRKLVCGNGILSAILLPSMMFDHLLGVFYNKFESLFMGN